MRSTILLAAAITLMTSSTSFGFEDERSSMFACCQHANSFHDFAADYRPHMQSYFSGSRGEQRNFTRYSTERHRAHNFHERY
jgi:hypothetical protein